jgi:hypothetical protein
MASGPKTNYLISTYKKSVEQDNTQKEQLQKVLSGIEIRTDDNTDPEYIIEGLDKRIDAYNPSTRGLDKKILQINQQIRSQQQQILILGQEANVQGCGITISPDIQEVVGDEVTLYSWSFSGNNPFVESSQVLSESNIGFGTYTGITTISLGTYMEFDPSGICAGYANSITTIINGLTTFRTERNNIINQLNLIKEARSVLELQRYGYTNLQDQLNAEIQKKNTIISVLENPINQQYFEE